MPLIPVRSGRKKRCVQKSSEILRFGGKGCPLLPFVSLLIRGSRINVINRDVNLEGKGKGETR